MLFRSIDDVNMQNIKLHYLRILGKIPSEKWEMIFDNFNINRIRRIQTNDMIDNKGIIKKSVSIGPGISQKYSTSLVGIVGQPITRLTSLQIPLPPAPVIASVTEPVTGSTDSSTSSIIITDTPSLPVIEQPGIYISTKDAFTLTDGPTIFLANDVNKIAKFCIQQANIPSKVMDDIMTKIEFNNRINERIRRLEKELEDINERLTIKDSNSSNVKNHKQEEKVKTATGSDATAKQKAEDELEYLLTLIKSAQLNETFIPNKTLHLKKWANNILNNESAYTSFVDEQSIIDIMLLDDVQDSWKILLLMGIGVFTNHPSIAYTEIMKKLIEHQKLYLIIASSDYIYGTNYQFCHGYLSKDMCLTQEKIIQSLGRIGRNNIQQNYSIRLRDDEQIQKLFYTEEDKPEVRNMNILFNSLSSST